MKVILSRKGFDSKYGGKPSIIYNNKFISIPIPGNNGLGITYKDLIFDNNYKFDKVLSDLKVKNFNGGLHLDHDLRHSILPSRSKKWKPAFGQEGAPQGLLKNCKVDKDDIFLFFGWFKEVEKDINDVFFYKKGASDIHAIFGYLQVDRIIDIDNEGIPVGLTKHPHVVMHDSYSNNYLYVGREHLSFDNTKPGFGTFEFDNSLVLTEKGQTRSVWELPPAFANEEKNFHISCQLNNLPNGNLEFRVSGIGNQEMYISDKPGVVNWAKKLLTSCKTYL